MPVIQIENLKKMYGKHVGTRDVSFSVNKGEIFGFVGPNGAGKTTTIKTLMGFIFSSSGKASIKGLDVRKESKAIKHFTGYVPSDVRLYPEMKVSELLKRNAAFYGKDCSDETKRLCELFEVDTNKRFHELSTGNKKKVSLVCAMMFKPEVIILDEPTNGLDPMMQKKLFEELKAQTQQGVTVLLSSHNLAEVEEYCQRVAFIKDGLILSVMDLSQAIDLHKIIRVSGAKGTVSEYFELMEADETTQVYRSKLKPEALLEAISALKADDFTVENETMEDYFWSLYKLEDGR